MKIALVWWFDKSGWVYPNWRDGLRAAIEEIAKKHDIGWYLDKTMPDPGEMDFLLFWSSSNEDYFNQLDLYKSERKGICLTTNPTHAENLRKMDIIFAESEPVYNEVRALGLPVIKAFGTDTDFFKPKKVKKTIEYFYPATFSPWKRQRDIAYLGDRLLCVGTIQPDGREDFDACKNAGVKVEVGYFHAPTIRYYYERTKNVIIPAVHGSERTVLEAMSMDILPTIVHSEINIKANSYLVEFKNSGLKSPREFVVKNYSYKIYAKQLLKGIE